MTVLLDTHALIWWLHGDARLSPLIRTVLEDPRIDVLVSAATVWEIGTKVRIGKLALNPTLYRDLEREISAQGFYPLPISVAHANRAAWLPGDHRDPFDRVIAAQALTENVSLVSVDTCFDAWAVKRLT